MTKLKKILSIVILFIVITLIGFLVYTGSRLSSYPTSYDEFINNYYTNDETTIRFVTEDSALYMTKEDRLWIEIKDYTEGFIVAEWENEPVYFVALENGLLYDVQKNTYLTKGGAV